MSHTDKELTRISREWDIPKSLLREYMRADVANRGILLKELKRRVCLRMLGQ